MAEKSVNQGTLFSYKCPCCGGQIEFDSESQKLKCPYCDTMFGIDDLKNDDALLNNEVSDSVSWQQMNHDYLTEEESQNMNLYVCNSCGGEIICDDTTAATFCPYCSSPVVMAGNLGGTLKPNYVIPFKLDKKAALAGLANHTKGKKFLPKLYSDQNHLDDIRPVYVPFWLYDVNSKAQARWKGTKIRHWSDSRYDYTETSYFRIYREGNLSFANVPVDGSKKIDDNLMESIEPFDFSQAVDFKTAYLSGYLADRYDESSSDCENRALARIKNTSEAMLASTAAGYATLTKETGAVSFKDGISKYVLYPVWILNTSWEGQNFIFAMNGQTGKFVGNLPLDKKAYWKWFFIKLLIWGAISFAVLALIWYMGR